MTPAPLAPIGTHLLTYTGHRNMVQAVAWSPDGTRLASGGDTPGWVKHGRDYSVQIWDPSTGQQLPTYHGHVQAVFTLAWSPDGTRIASAGDHKRIHVWDAASGEPLLTHDAHMDQIRAVAWSPDGTRLASAGFDQTIRVWDTATGKHLLTYDQHNHPVHTLAWSPDGQRIASGGGHLPAHIAAHPNASRDFGIHVWEATTGQRLLVYQSHTAKVRALAWAPSDGSAHASDRSDRIASTGVDKTLQVWSATTGQQFHVYSGDMGDGHAVAWSPDGAYLASGGNSTGWVNGHHHYSVQIREASTGQQIVTYNGHKDTVLALAWSPDGDRMASASQDTTVQVWSAQM